ncbi:hypothetical protein M513_01914, partial [Trichuris suis]
LSLSHAGKEVHRVVAIALLPFSKYQLSISNGSPFNRHHSSVKDSASNYEAAASVECITGASQTSKNHPCHLIVTYLFIPVASDHARLIICDCCVTSFRPFLESIFTRFKEIRTVFTGGYFAATMPTVNRRHSSVKNCTSSYDAAASVECIISASESSKGMSSNERKVEYVTHFRPQYENFFQEMCTSVKRNMLFFKGGQPVTNPALLNNNLP